MAQEKKKKNEVVLMELVGTQDINTLAHALLAIDDEEADHEGMAHSTLQVRANKSGHIQIGYFHDGNNGDGRNTIQ